MTKRRTPPNGNAHAAAVPGKIEPRADADPALMDVVLPAGLDGESVDAMTAAGADTHVPADLAAGDAEVGNTLQTYLREIRRAPLLTPQEEFDTATRSRTGAEASDGAAASSTARGRGTVTSRSNRSSSARESLSR